MALRRIFLLFSKFADALGTVLLKVLTLQQLNYKNIRKMVVLSLHEPISGTSWFLTNVAEILRKGTFTGHIILPLA
jgi:hypothetical protein